MNRRFEARRGFTLLEGLFSLFIVFLVLGGLSHTLSQAATVKKNTKHLDQATEEFHSLFTMRNDVMAALAIISPSAGATAGNLRLLRVNPDMSYATRTDVIGDPLNAFEPSEQVTVEYQVEDELLKRDQTAPSGVTSTERLIEAELLEVTLSSTAPSLLTIRLSLERARVTKQRSLKIAVSQI
ncbi:MAG: hypothetical protein WC423_22195 [Vulcanimicrobiota bacterium]